jgi:hypothetical protein
MLSRLRFSKSKLFRSSCFLLSALCLLTASPLSRSEEQTATEQTLSVGAYYSNGDYGEPVDTEIFYFPVSYERRHGKWGFLMSLPHLEVSGLGNVLPNVGGVNPARAGTQQSTSRGLGDAQASVIYQFDPVSANTPFIDLRFDVKIPTADEEKSLGTGEYDYSMQLDLYQALASSTLFGSVGYSFRGKSTLFEGLKDGAYVQLGVTRPLSDRWSIGVIYDYREAASSFSAETHEVLPYFSWEITGNWSFTGYAAKGFTESSPDIAVVGQLNYHW